MPKGHFASEGFWLPLNLDSPASSEWNFFSFSEETGPIEDGSVAKINDLWISSEKSWIIGGGNIDDEWEPYLARMHALGVTELEESGQDAVDGVPSGGSDDGDSPSSTVREADGEPTFPTFPLWDNALPTPTARIKLDRVVFEAPTATELDLGTVSARISTVLQERDYPYTFFDIPGGFVVVAGLEAYNCESGRREESIEGSVSPVVLPVRVFSNGVFTDPEFVEELSKLIDNFTLENFGSMFIRYVPKLLKRWSITHDCHRFIMFAVKDDFLTTDNMGRGRKIYKRLEDIVATGSDDIPEIKKHVVYGMEYDTTILIYQFVVTEVLVNGVPGRSFKFIRPSHSCPPRMLGAKHVVAAGMDALLTEEQQREKECIIPE